MKQVTIRSHTIILIILDYGARIQKLLLKDKDGNYTNVVVGLEYPSHYLQDSVFLGACIGRYAGRIGKHFLLDRETYHLYAENGVHHNGGKEGFDKKVWNFEEVQHGEEPFVKLSYLSKHLEEGYPGNLKITVTYKLVGESLHILHEATTDRTTVVNLTNHSYFRLDDSNSLKDHRLQLNCPLRAETGANFLPSGTILSVEDTDYNFLVQKSIGNTTLNIPFVIDPKATYAAKVSSKKSGISMKITTDQPAIMAYIPEEFPAICLETQNLPDAPNHENFPNCVLRPGEKYRNESEFRFAFS